MARCECIDGCIFFHDKMAKVPIMAGLYKQQYCLRDNTQCARYMVFKAKGPGSVPSDLYPNDTRRVKALIED